MTSSPLAGIQYVGITGITSHSKRAIMRFIQNNDRITSAKILTHGNSHCFLLTVNDDFVAVKSGFSSGYDGEGPRGFSYIIQLLTFHGIEMQEYDVTLDFIERLDLSALTIEDIEKIHSAYPINPNRLDDYINHLDFEKERNGKLWQNFRPILPLSVIDTRIVDLALNFWKDPDQSLTTAYRRLEDILRARTGSKEYGVGLFSEVFLGQKAKLGWKDLDTSEQKGRATLFTSIYMAYRNPRAHQEIKGYFKEQVAEFMLLNQLYILEQQASELY